mmetsp:Transcript_77219/g.136794  ORF Transcript_77219/g.136794 Transcript_77219/m.136794 type:complete len:232 (-) Transcript_77219:74-769(-)
MDLAKSESVAVRPSDPGPAPEVEEESEAAGNASLEQWVSMWAEASEASSPSSAMPDMWQPKQRGKPGGKSWGLPGADAELGAWLASWSEAAIEGPEPSVSDALNTYAITLTGQSAQAAPDDSEPPAAVAAVQRALGSACTAAAERHGAVALASLKEVVAFLETAHGTDNEAGPAELRHWLDDYAAIELLAGSAQDAVLRIMRLPAGWCQDPDSEELEEAVLEQAAALIAKL